MHSYRMISHKSIPPKPQRKENNGYWGILCGCILLSEWGGWRVDGEYVGKPSGLDSLANVHGFGPVDKTGSK